MEIKQDTKQVLIDRITNSFNNNSSKIIAPFEADYFGFKVGKEYPNKTMIDAYISKLKYYILAIDNARDTGEFLGESLEYYRVELNEFQNTYHLGLGQDFDRVAFEKDVLSTCERRLNDLETRIETKKYFFGKKMDTTSLEKSYDIYNRIMLCMYSTQPTRDL